MVARTDAAAPTTMDHLPGSSGHDLGRQVRHWPPALGVPGCGDSGCALLPSGHATALIGFLGYVTACDLLNLRARFEVVFWSAAIIGLVCFSRIFLSLHYLSDVAAELLLGAFCLVFGFAVTEVDRRPPA
jgi:membrane-associated phospholipid phosphatase